MNILNLSGLSLRKPISEFGNTGISQTANKFEEDLKVLLMTEKGTMLGDPEFGSDLYKYLFNKSNELTASLIRDEIKRCVEEYFDYVLVKNIDIEFDGNNVNAKITYSLYMQNNDQIVTLTFLRKG